MLFDTIPIARRYLVSNTHDGVLMSFPRREPESLTMLFGLFGWLIVGWLSLLLLAYPVAAFVEAQRWWDVNERVLQFRWMAIGLPLWPVLFSAVWLWIRGSSHLRVKVDQHALRWKGRFGWRRVAWSELEKVTVRPRRLAVTTKSGRTYHTPTLENFVLRALHGFILDQWSQAEVGSERDVPEDIRRLVAQRRAAMQATSADQSTVDHRLR
ncbi:MAG: hypothetical protein AAGA48_27500 [Myxococcota bacterium]